MLKHKKHISALKVRPIKAEEADKLFKQKLALQASEIRTAFRMIDKNFSGTIDHSEFRTIMSNFNIEIEDAEFIKMIDKYDHDNNGICYREFMQAFGAELQASCVAEGEGGISSILTHKTKRNQGTAKALTVNAMLELIRKKMHGAKTCALMPLFRKFDKDGSGTIEQHELELILNNWGIEVTESQAKALMNRLDSDGKGHLDYNEFIGHFMDDGATSLDFNKGTAALAHKSLISRIESGFRNLRDAFRHYDLDKDGSIDLHELRKACDHAGVSLSKAGAQKLMAMIDSNHDGKIDNADFMHATDRKHRQWW